MSEDYAEHKAKPKRGPKPKPESEQRKRRVSVYLTDPEYAYLIERAGSPKRVPALLRDAGMKRKQRESIPELNQEAWGHLGKVKGGLSSLAKAAREGQILEWTHHDRELVEGLLRQIKALRAELIGVAYEG